MNVRLLYLLAAALALAAAVVYYFSAAAGDDVTFRVAFLSLMGLVMLWLGLRAGTARR